MKTVNEVLGKQKGEKAINEIMTGKGSFSKQGFSDLVNSMANDTTFKVPTFSKDGTEGSMNLSELIRADMKKTMQAAGWPQKPEAGVLDSCDISTNGLAEAIPHIIMAQIACGKKFDLPAQKNVGGSIYLAKVPGKTRTLQVRDPKTQEDRGSAIITTKDSIQIRAKSPVPKHLQTKIRKDPAGKVIG